MACRIRKDRFAVMVGEEAGIVGLNAHVEVDQADPVERFHMAEVDRGIAVLNRKAIQSLVDEPEQARVLVRNLLRWAKEHGAK